MTRTQEYAEKVKHQIDALAAEIDSLAAGAEKLSGNAKVEMNRQIAELRDKQKAAEEQLKRLLAAGNGALGELKSGMETAIKDMMKATDRAMDKLKKL
jgi:ElaB/YqjD/DUF883 family membrane-anchored ribosome-binding protein